MDKVSVLTALKGGTDYLKQAEIDDADVSSRHLLESVLSIQNIHSLLDLDKELSEVEFSGFEDLLKLRKSGIPLQYLSGRAAFRHLDLKVNRHVMIPRFDTECVAGEVIKIIGNISDPLVLDVGTGSGAIALSVAWEIKKARVVATDISNEALRVAYENAIRYSLTDRIEFVRSDLFSEIPGEPIRQFDVIVSNPPYIPPADVPGLAREVRDHEPLLSFLAGEDGMYYFKKIIPKASHHLMKNGHLVLEIGDGQSNEVRRIICSTGCFNEPYTVADINGHERVLVASSKGKQPRCRI